MPSSAHKQHKKHKHAGDEPPSLKPNKSNSSSPLPVASSGYTFSPTVFSYSNHSAAPPPSFGHSAESNSSKQQQQQLMFEADFLRMAATNPLFRFPEFASMASTSLFRAPVTKKVLILAPVQGLILPGDHPRPLQAPSRSMPTPRRPALSCPCQPTAAPTRRRPSQPPASTISTRTSPEPTTTTEAAHAREQKVPTATCPLICRVSF